MAQYRLTKTQEDLGCAAKSIVKRRYKNMKSKLVIGILVLAALFCQGLVFAETTSDVTAVAEEIVVTEDPATGVVEETVVEEELVAPGVEPVKEAAEDVEEEVVVEEVTEEAAM